MEGGRLIKLYFHQSQFLIFNRFKFILKLHTYGILSDDIYDPSQRGTAIACAAFAKKEGIFLFEGILYYTTTLYASSVPLGDTINLYFCIIWAYIYYKQTPVLIRASESRFCGISRCVFQVFHLDDGQLKESTKFEKQF